MRGRKLQERCDELEEEIIKKESPNEGTETIETFISLKSSIVIKKESPNEGTETIETFISLKSSIVYKKRIPE